MKKTRIPDELKRFDPGAPASEETEEGGAAAEPAPEGTGALAD